MEICRCCGVEWWPGVHGGSLRCEHSSSGYWLKDHGHKTPLEEATGRQEDTGKHQMERQGLVYEPIRNTLKKAQKYLSDTWRRVGETVKHDLLLLTAFHFYHHVWYTLRKHKPHFEFT